MENFYKFIKPFLKNKKNLLDIGCGSCRDVLFFKKFLKVECVEPSKEFRKICLKKIPLLKIYNQKLPFLKIRKKFDVISLISLWMHLPKNSYQKAVLNIKKRLNKGSIVILSYSINKREGFERIDPKEVKKIFLKNGFRILKEAFFEDSLKRDFKWVVQVFILDKIS